MDLQNTYNIDAVVIIDFETTGLDPKSDHPTEVALKRLKKNVDNVEYETLIKLPEGVEIEEHIKELTGLDTEEVNSEGETKETVKGNLQRLIDGNTLVIAQNANFDLGFLYHHFEIEPAFFFCTKTVEFMTHPDKSTRLNDMYKRYSSAPLEQTHRAMDDVEMLKKVSFEQEQDLGEAHNYFFLNRIAVMPERPLVFTPHNAEIVDFSKLYVKRSTMDKEIGAVSDKLQQVANERDEYKIEAYGDFL